MSEVKCKWEAETQEPQERKERGVDPKTTMRRETSADVKSSMRVMMFSQTCKLEKKILVAGEEGGVDPRTTASEKGSGPENRRQRKRR